MMIKILKNLFRDIKKNKLFSVINISGLAVGMACALLIFLWVNFELSHDDFHQNKKNIYQVSYKNESYYLPGPLATQLKKDFPEIKEATPYLHRQKCKLVQDKQGYFAAGSYVDQSFLSIFSFPLIKGNHETLLTSPNSIVLTQQLAKKIFGAHDPMGKVVQLDDGYLKKTQPMIVTGILEDIPVNTHLKEEGENKFEFLIPFQRTPEWIQKRWRTNMVQAYVLLKEDATLADLNQKISGIVEKHNPRNERKLSLVPLKNVYLYNPDGGGRFQNIYLFSFVALFILIIAGINFINLSTVRSEQWARQIAVKKVMGASRKSLIRQFLTESIFFTYVAMIGAVIICELMLPSLNNLFSSNIKVQYLSFHLLLIVLLPLIIGSLAGIYPAFVLSSFSPVKILGSNSRGNAKSSGIFRSGLIILQFSLSIILVVFGFVIYQQNNHLSKQNLGYQKENLLMVGMSGDLKKSFNVVKDELLKISGVKGVSYSNNPITHRYWTTGSLKWEGQPIEQDLDMGMDKVGYDLDKVIGIDMLQGRFFSRNFSTDATKGVVVNEAAIKKMNLKNPLGMLIKNINGGDYNIIGVMKNFHTESLHQQIKPHLYIYGKVGYHMYIKLIPGNQSMAKLIKEIGKTIKTFVPTDPFAFSFLDSAINKLYHSEKVTQTLINFSTLITLIISCLGLIGLSFYTTRQKIKEIGIRRVLGETVTGLVLHLTKNIIKLVIIANIIAWPIAWLIANNWLQNFAYKIDLNIWTLLLAGIFTISIALLTVSYQTVKAANLNPAECLKRE